MDHSKGLKPTIIPFKELPLKNDFMFGEVMRDETICKLFLEDLLGVEIERIEVVDKQKDLSDTAHGHGVRLDAYVRDGKGTVYNIEIQVKRDGTLEYRIVHYHSLIKRDTLAKGLSYAQTNHSYVIFICDFDFYGDGLAVNEWETRVKESNHLVENGTHSFVLNSKYKIPNAKPSILEFLDYVRTGKESPYPQSELVKRTQQRVETIRYSENEEADYMIWSLCMEQMKLEASEEARAEGEAKGKALGKMEERKSIVLDILETLKDVSQVAKLMKMPVEEVQKIADENHLQLG